MASGAIIIPIYKDEITHYESISMRQCYEVLGNHNIIFVAPERLIKSTFYKEEKGKAEFIFLDNQNFESIISYNHMLLSDWFYKKFIAYEYILIYQLDSFVFKDELNYWTEKGYSYVGAPWFEGNSNDSKIDGFMGVGNGGFSLRNVKDCMTILKSNKKIYSLKEYIAKNKASKNSLYILRGIKHYLMSSTFESIRNDELVNEDKIFSLAGKRFKNFIIPTPQEASKFAFEKQPKKLFLNNNNQLPFGCHAWWTYDLDFYIPFLKKNGYRLNDN